MSLFPWLHPKKRSAARGQLTDQVLEQTQWGELELTDAVRPLDSHVRLRRGFFQHTHRDQIGNATPALIINETAPHLWDLFHDLLGRLQALGVEHVDVILEKSCGAVCSSHIDMDAGPHELVILRSNLLDFEDVLLHDGFVGIAVLSSYAGVEIQFNDDKFMALYAKTRRRLNPFLTLLRKRGLPQHEHLTIISKLPHVHISNGYFESRFEELCFRLGVNEDDSMDTD
jgi:hypothetical protein